MTRLIFEYAINAVWLTALLTMATAAATQWLRPSTTWRHRMWLTALAMSVTLPLIGVGRQAAPRTPTAMATTTAQTFAPTPEAPATTKAATLADNAPTPTPLHSFAPQKPAETTEVVAPKRSAFDGVRTVRATVGARMQWIVSLLVALAALLCALRLLRAWLAARRMMRRAQRVNDELLLSTLDECAERMRVSAPETYELAECSTPAMVGLARPRLLLPTGFAQSTREQMEAAFCHELAHLRRRDGLANLLCRAASLPLAWHPATRWLLAGVDGSREACCDQMAADAMQAPLVYARALLSLAEGMRQSPEALPLMAQGMFGFNTLEERIMRITESKPKISAAARRLRAVIGVAAALTICLLASLLHVTPVMAAEPQTPATQQQTQIVAHNGGSTQIVIVDKREIGGERIRALAHGDKAKVKAGKGEYAHRWTGRDGKPFVIVTDRKEEPDEATRARIEEQMSRMRMSSPTTFTITTGDSGAAAGASLNAEQLRSQIAAAMKDAEQGRQLAFTIKAERLAETQNQLKSSMEKLRQMRVEINGRDLEELQKLSTLHLQLQQLQQLQASGKNARVRVFGAAESQEWEQTRQQVEEARKQLEEARRQLEESRKQLAEAQRQLAGARAK